MIKSVCREKEGYTGFSGGHSEGQVADVPQSTLEFSGELARD